MSTTTSNGRYSPSVPLQIIDNRHPFPFLANKGIYVGLYFESHKDTVFGIIPAVGAFDRICTLPGPGIRFVLIEDIIYHYAGTIFGSHNLLDRMIFRVTRSADIITETMPFDDDIDFRTTMKELLKKRVKLAPVRLEIRGELKKEFIRYLCKKLLLHQSNVFMSRSPLDLSYVYRFADRVTEAHRKRLLFPPLSPQPAQAVLPNVPVMRQVLTRDLLFSYPYESLRHFLQLLDEAADDPDVASIRITLYRVGKEAKLIRSLMRAAENGKEVLAVVELNARFDEEDNIEWATQLSNAGCRVVYGIEEYKVHSKVLLIMRKSDRSIQYITQIGTGNYNERTSRQYTDFSLLTSNPEIGLDAVSLFNDILVNNLEGKYRLLWVAPSNMQANIIARIDNEIAHARAGRQAGIFVKMNSLTNKDVIDKLIEASQAGVRIRMIVRGICCLRPGVPGLTDNITVVSIVGRFLEHARVYCFGDGARRDVYISSADWMTRNLERRIEVACPVLDGVLARRITDMLETQLRDNVKARVLQPDGSYARQHGETADGEPAEALDSQMQFLSSGLRARQRQGHKQIILSMFPFFRFHISQTADSKSTGSVSGIFYIDLGGMLYDKRRSGSVRSALCRGNAAIRRGPRGRSHAGHGGYRERPRVGRAVHARRQENRRRDDGTHPGGNGESRRADTRVGGKAARRPERAGRGRRGVGRRPRNGGGGPAGRLGGRRMGRKGRKRQDRRVRHRAVRERLLKARPIEGRHRQGLCAGRKGVWRQAPRHMHADLRCHHAKAGRVGNGMTPGRAPI